MRTSEGHEIARGEAKGVGVISSHSHQAGRDDDSASASEVSPSHTPDGSANHSGTVTRLVNSMASPGGVVDQAAFERLYNELRRLAAIALRSERNRGQLQTTALVHEALLKLQQFECDQQWQSKAHFFGSAARAMRQILVDEARRRAADGRILRILSEASEKSSREVELLSLDEAVSALERHDQLLCQIVMLRVFAGMTVEEVSSLLNRSERSIKRDWQVARAWVLRWLIDKGQLERDRDT